MASFSSLKADVFAREQRRLHHGSYIMGLNAYDRHKKFMDDYVHCYPGHAKGSEPMPLKTDMDTLRENYRFIRTEEDDAERTWEQRLAKRYYDKLFKEYCIADMSRYKESKIGFRWRTEKEVVSGKGQFICGNRKCNEEEALRSYEVLLVSMTFGLTKTYQGILDCLVNFTYKEFGENRQALVKLRVCPRCAYKLSYKKEKEYESQFRKEQREIRKRKRKGKSEVSKKKPNARKQGPSSKHDEDQGGSSGSDSGDYSESPCNEMSGGIGLRSSARAPAHSTHLAPTHGTRGIGEFEEFFEGMFL